MYALGTGPQPKRESLRSVASVSLWCWCCVLCVIGCPKKKTHLKMITITVPRGCFWLAALKWVPETLAAFCAPNSLALLVKAALEALWHAELFVCWVHFPVLIHDRDLCLVCSVEISAFLRTVSSGGLCVSNDLRKPGLTTTRTWVDMGLAEFLC